MFAMTTDIGTARERCPQAHFCGIIRSGGAVPSTQGLITDEGPFFMSGLSS